MQRNTSTSLLLPQSDSSSTSGPTSYQHSMYPATPTAATAAPASVLQSPSDIATVNGVTTNDCALPNGGLNLGQNTPHSSYQYSRSSSPVNGSLLLIGGPQHATTTTATTTQFPSSLISLPMPAVEEIEGEDNLSPVDVGRTTKPHISHHVPQYSSSNGGSSKNLAVALPPNPGGGGGGGPGSGVPPQQQQSTACSTTAGDSDDDEDDDFVRKDSSSLPAAPGGGGNNKSLSASSCLSRCCVRSGAACSSFAQSCFSFVGVLATCSALMIALACALIIILWYITTKCQ